jgi:hypothetical protein
MYCFFEERNHSKAISRLGDEDHGTHHTEKLIALNSYALSVGVARDKLPYKNITAPRDSSEHKKYMGFSYNLPNGLHNVSNPAEGDKTIDDDQTEDSSEDDVSSNKTNEIKAKLRELFGDDMDIESFANEEEEYLEASSQRNSRTVE